MQAPQIVAHTKILFSIMIGGCLGIMAWLDLQLQAPMAALVTAGLSMLMVINGLCLLVTRGHTENPFVEGLFMLVLASFSFWSVQEQGPSALHWMYFYPLAALFLFNLKVASLFIFSYLPVAAYIAIKLSDPLLQHQVIISFVIISLVTLFLAIVKARTNQLLEPLVSADLATGAQQEKRLLPELGIEINRAEREGTGLLLMLLGTGAPLKKFSKSQRNRLLQEAASVIVQHLRPFDAFYRLHNDDFAVVLPHTTSTEAEPLAHTMLAGLPKSLQRQAQTSFASLNVEDTADSLLHNAKELLTQKEQLTHAGKNNQSLRNA